MKKPHQKGTKPPKWGAWRRKGILVLLLLPLFLLGTQAAGIRIDLGSESGGSLDALQLLLVFALLALAPTLLIMMTSFTRIIIVLSFLRNALGLQQTPPNQVLIGLALFLSLFIMNPVITEMNETALAPYLAGELSQEEMTEKIVVPVKQ